MFAVNYWNFDILHHPILYYNPYLFLREYGEPQLRWPEKLHYYYKKLSLSACCRQYTEIQPYRRTADYFYLICHRHAAVP